MTKAKFKSDIHKVLSKSMPDIRKQALYFNKGFIYATNGYIAVKQEMILHGFKPEEIEFCQDKLLHYDKVELINKWTKQEGVRAEFGRSEIEILQGERLIMAIQYDNVPIESPYFEMDSVLYLHAQREKIVKDIDFSSEHLLTIANAFVASNSMVHLRFISKDKNIIVTPTTPYGEGEQVGIISPYKTYTEEERNELKQTSGESFEDIENKVKNQMDLF
jgi:hypothetical protein